MKTPTVDFLAPELDAFVARWLGNGLSGTEATEWRRLLSQEPRFREEFCDWIRSLREPAWIRDRQPVSKRART